MGITEQADERVLFTNSDDLPDLMNDRAQFFCIRGNDLDRLEARDFEVIRKWLWRRLPELPGIERVRGGPRRR